jgi:cell division protein ZipA
MCMLTWTYLKNKKSREDLDFHDDQDTKEQRHKPVPVNDEKMDSKPIETVNHYFDQDDSVYEPEEHNIEPQEEDIEPPPRFSVPAIIQFSLIAKAEEGFNGIDLVNAFGIVGLEYGNLKIYERLDANRLVDFGVACMVEPGTFPSSDLDTFYCPGLVFFMQPAALDDAQAVFDDYLDTIELLAIELDGTIRDHHRQPLTDATVQSIRQSL